MCIERINFINNESMYLLINSLLDRFTNINYNKNKTKTVNKIIIFLMMFLRVTCRATQYACSFILKTRPIVMF